MKESERNIGEEILAAVKEIQAGGGRRFTVSIPSVVEARQNIGMSQTEFAALLGVSVRTLQDWEQGRREPSGAAKTLLRIASQNPDAVQRDHLI